VDTPVVRSARDNLEMTVDDSKDIRFFRHRREAVSVFDMNTQLQEMAQTIKDLTKELASQKEDVKESVAKSVDDLTSKLDDKSEELDKKSADLKTELTKKSADLKTELTQGMEVNKNALDQTVEALTDKVDQSAAATTAALDKSKKDTTAALDKSKKDAATANTVFKKTITDSIDSKLKPFSGAEKAIASLKTTHYGDSSIPVYRYAWFHTYQAARRWFDENRANGFGGVTPHDWTDGNGRADQMGNDFKYLQRIFTRKGQASKFGGTICAEAYGQRSSTNGGVCGALFRIRNTGKSTVRWNPTVTMTSYSGWSERASISMNGNNLIGGRNCGDECRFSQNIDIPANSAGNRISTVVFISTGSYDVHTYGSHYRHTLLTFGDNSLSLPNGLEYVNDLDVVTGAWKK